MLGRVRNVAVGWAEGQRHLQAGLEGVEGVHAAVFGDAGSSTSDHVAVGREGHSGLPQLVRRGEGEVRGRNETRATRCVTRCTSRHTSHVTRHTSHVTRHTSHVTRHTSHVTRHTSRVQATLTATVASSICGTVMSTGGTPSPPRGARAHIGEGGGGTHECFEEWEGGGGAQEQKNGDKTAATSGGRGEGQERWQMIL